MPKVLISDSLDNIASEILIKNNISVDTKKIKKDWDLLINETLSEAKLKRPKDEYMATGGKKGIHTESLGFLLAEMQFLQRAYPNAKW